MKCFEVGEFATRGIRIERFPAAHVHVLGSAPILLDAKLTSFVSQVPKELGDIVITEASPLFAGGTLLLASETSEWKGSKALVHIETHAGTGGTADLTADAWTEEVSNGKVVRLWRPFPPPGVKIVYGGEVLTTDDGVERLELIVVMDEQASFRITRTGDLQGASPDIFVRWYGDNLVTRVPGRFRRMHEEQRLKREKPRTRARGVPKKAKQA